MNSYNVMIEGQMYKMSAKNLQQLSYAVEAKAISIRKRGHTDEQQKS